MLLGLPRTILAEVRDLKDERRNCINQKTTEWGGRIDYNEKEYGSVSEIARNDKRCLGLGRSSRRKSPMGAWLDRRRNGRATSHGIRRP